MPKYPKYAPGAMEQDLYPVTLPGYAKHFRGTVPGNDMVVH